MEDLSKQHLDVAAGRPVAFIISFVELRGVGLGGSVRTRARSPAERFGLRWLVVMSGFYGALAEDASELCFKAPPT